MSLMLPATYVPSFHELESVKSMNYSKFGETNVGVSCLGFGGATVALCNTLQEEQEGIQTIIKAIKSGINYIDTAPYYGEGKSEIVLGKALKSIPREAYYIGTKVGRYTTNIPTMFDFSAERTLKSIDESLSRLGLTYVDLIQVHDVEFAPSIDIIVNETLPALQTVKESGRAKYIGITGYPLQLLKEIAELSKIKIDFVLSYCRCTLFDSTLLEYIPYFKGKGIGIINAAILGMSLCTNDRLPSWHPAKSALRAACAEAAQYCREHDVSICKLGLHFSVTQPGISTHLVGMKTQKELNENLDVLLHGLTKQEMDVLQEVQNRFFEPLGEKHWENCEVEKYWKIMNELEE